MANHTITISNEINVFGGSPLSSWNVYNWGFFNWGEGTAPVIWTLDHLISNSLSIDSGFSGKDIEKFLAESISPVTDLTEANLLDQNGYYYVYVPNTTNAENRVSGNYTSNVASSVSWVSNPSGSLSWS